MIYSLGELRPNIHQDAFIAPSAEIIGDVTLGEDSSIWFNCTIRGDVYPIRIGKFSNIQDNSVIHVTGGKYSTVIHDHVTVGHRCIIHGATLHNYAFVGMGAILLDQVEVESYGFVAAGALVTPKFKVPAHTLVAGVPAKIIREITSAEKDMIDDVARRYVENRALFMKSLQPL